MALSYEEQIRIEMEKIKDKAERSGMSVSEFLAQAGLHRRVRK